MGYIVYIHTTPNGKKYIGITCQNPQKRWQNGLGYKTSPRFYGAILKYGWNNINHEIVFENLTKSEAEQKEIQLIAFYKSNDRHFGYNIESGGNSIGRISNETKQKISLKCKGLIPSLETRQKQSKSHRRENLSAQTLEKMSKSHIGKKQTESTKRKIGDKRRGKVNSQEVINKMILAKQSKSKPFFQYTKDMILIREWASLSAYERETGNHKRHVGRCLKGEVETSYGYIWKYKE